MSHCYLLAVWVVRSLLDPTPNCQSLKNDFLDLHPCEGGAVALRAPHPFAPLLLEHADFRPASLAFDHGHDTSIRDEWRAGDDVSAVLFDE